jgi:hypothetical protein
VEQTFLIERTNNYIARNKKLCIGEQKGKFRNNNLWYSFSENKRNKNENNREQKKYSGTKMFLGLVLNYMWNKLF